MTNRKLLIIEDDIEIAASIRDIFEDCGYEIFTAFNGVNGIEQATELIPDLIICDITMPKANGYQVKSVLSKNAGTCGIPFIFLTANADLSSMRKAMDLGADDYVVKPVTVENLYEIVNKRINHINDLKTESVRLNNSGYALSDKILLKKNKEQIITKVEDISVIKSLGVYTQVILSNGEKIIIKRSLKKWNEQLPADYYIKVHRNYIININWIDKILNGNKGAYNILIKGHKEIIVSSQRYSQKIRKMNLFGNT
jgi:DNA-binding LytR/AlgR family response regulator